MEAAPQEEKSGSYAKRLADHLNENQTALQSLTHMGIIYFLERIMPCFKTFSIYFCAGFS
jgi:hypothetical protein